ncbi:hypothetical protein FHR70_000658 [Microvirga lupini]|uniref:Uncharacterized protein n=2 Tax=Microvirga lupini TaxID=420324 RepID=A0A7W4YW38_9HYPH|nr:hypothetical protein [Microvirga lupini]
MRAAARGAKGVAPELTDSDLAAADVAAKHPEHVLRQAVVMRAAFEREALKNPPKTVGLDLPVVPA